jgi:DNA-binding sugar fermentation-stimulating protein
MNYVEALFIKEESNRFSVLVKIKEEIVGCYLPYSSKLGNALNLYGKKVLILPINGKRFKYKIVAIVDNDNIYYVDLNNINALFEESFANKYLSNYTRENRITNNYRADFVNRNAKQVLEIKTLLSPDKNAIYPSVNPIRFNKQMKELALLSEQGYTVIIILILLNRNIHQISINQKYTEFSQMFFSLLLNQCELHIHEIKYINDNFLLSDKIIHDIDYDSNRIILTAT